MKINEICKKNREILGLTVNEFAMSMNLDANLYNKFEKGKYLFSKEILKEILCNLYVEKEDLLEVDIDDDILNISMKAINICEEE